MGILINALAISVGSFLGSIFKEHIKLRKFDILGIAIMIISMAGFFENIFNVDELTLKSNNLLVVVFALIVGTITGDAMQLETKINSISNSSRNSFSVFIDTAIFFGVGGMQICGPVLMATVGDNSQLILKSMIDFPFAVMFGISYGKKVSLSALPVATVQLLIALLSALSKNFLDDAIIKQLCSLGYIILFFTGFNLICSDKYKVKTINMIIGIFIILLYNLLLKLWR